MRFSTLMTVSPKPHENRRRASNMTAEILSVHLVPEIHFSERAGLTRVTVRTTLDLTLSVSLGIPEELYLEHQ